MVRQHKPLPEQTGLFPDEGVLPYIMQEKEPVRPVTEDSKQLTQPGDLWTIGPHRLLCGDAANSDDFTCLMNGKKAQLIHTDPPYNVGVKYRGDKETDAKARELKSDSITPEKYLRLLQLWFHHCSCALEPGRSFYIWGGFVNIGRYPAILRVSGLFLSQTLIWVKNAPSMNRGDFMFKHEWCFYGWKEGAAHRWFGPNNITDVWDIPGVSRTQRIHLTEKPVEIPLRAIKYSSQPGEIVLDLFAGSGSTLIAAAQLDRVCYLMEIDPWYCDLIIERCKGLELPIKRFKYEG